ALSQSLAMASIAERMAGDRPASVRLLDEARAVTDGLDDLGSVLMLRQAAALNGLIDGDAGAVMAVAVEGERLAREAGDLYSLDMMLMNQGFAALEAGDLGGAERRFAEGLRIARQLDDRVAQCYLLGALGCCAAGSGEPRLAAQLLGAMDSLRAEAGATMHPGMAGAMATANESVTAALGPARFEALLGAGRRLGRDAAARLALRESGPAPDPAAEPEPAGAGVLGRREADVARLVAEGLTNKEIGARLFISERTVESHVRSVLNKLGFNSRAQIAAWMAAADGV
ncbi:MAG TPA: LuxR C-terminal-related transcriptional regulator, partial [Candidatus Dormibacteraeota bacterium]